MNMAKDSVVAVRLEKHLVELLKEQTIIWGTATLSGTLREIIKMFFAPVLFEAQGKDIEKLRSGKLFSQEEFDKEIKRFIVFLREVQEKGLRSMEYISEALEDYEEMEQREKEFKDRWQRARIEK
jgi:hypothetical protein